MIRKCKASPLTADPSFAHPLYQIGKMQLAVAVCPNKINDSRFARLKFDFWEWLTSALRRD
jgi:hypothetical protein